MFGAAIVGIVGAAGVFIYEQIYAEKRRAMLGKWIFCFDALVPLFGGYRTLLFITQEITYTDERALGFPNILEILERNLRN